MGEFEITKAGFLPNISENFGYFRQTAVNQFEKKQFVSAASSLYNLNSCLGEEYLVTISTTRYSQAVKNRSAYQCNHCTMPFTKIINKGEENESTKEIQIPTEILISEVKVFDVILPIIDSIIQKSDTMKIWICPECKKENEIDKTVPILPKTVNPFFYKVVWDCPIRLSGIGNKLGFNEKFQSWFDNFLQEINWQEVLYRKEYKAQHGFDMEESDFKDKGDQR